VITPWYLLNIIGVHRFINIQDEKLVLRRSETGRIGYFRDEKRMELARGQKKMRCTPIGIPASKMHMTLDMQVMMFP